MPTTHYPAKYFTPTGEIPPDSGVAPGVTVFEGAKIRTVGADGVTFSRSGTVLDSADFTTKVVPMSGLSEVFGVAVAAEFPDGTTAADQVSLQVTVDGTNYLWWDGNNWTQPGANDFNTVAEINEKSSDLPLANPRKLGFKVRLTSLDNETPLLRGMAAFVEFEVLTYLDLFETLHDIMTERFSIPVTRQLVLEAATTSFQVDSEYTPKADGTFKVFNISNDPNKNTNLFDNFNAGTSTITLTAQQAIDSVIEFTFDGTCTVQVTRADEMIEIATLPVTLVMLEDVVGVPNRLAGRVSELKAGIATTLVRTRLHPVYRSVDVTMEHSARSPREAISGASIMERIINRGIVLLSTGELVKVVVKSSSALMDFPGQSYFSGVFTARLFFYEHALDYQQFQALGKVDIDMGDLSSEWQDDNFQVGD